MAEDNVNEPVSEMHEGVDPALEMWVGSVNNPDADEERRIELTIMLGGTWVTGYLVGGRTWFRALADSSGLETLADMGPSWYPTRDEVSAAGHDPALLDERVFGYLHLTEARSVGSAGMIPSNRGVPLRVPLREVQAWTIGMLSSAGPVE